MDVDTTEANALSVEEQNKLQKEGCCFNYRKTGHMSRACPTKQDTPKKSQRTTIQVAKAKEGDKKKEVSESIKAMTMEERNELLNDLILAGF
jgi:hypothetical protein